MAAQSIDIGFHLPDAAVEVPETARHEAGRGLLRVDGEGAFIRCLLAVALSGEFELGLGIWLRVDDDTFARAEAVWNEPAYAGLALSGTVANDVQPWDLRGSEATTAVTNPEELPYITTHPVLDRIWDRDEVLRHFGCPLPVPVRTPLSDEWTVERTAGLASRVVEGTMRFGGPGRTVYVDAYGDNLGRSPEEFLRGLLDGAPEVPAEQTFTSHSGDEVRHAFWHVATVDGRTQHELYGFVVRPGTALQVGCFHDEPADHAWAMHVFNSAGGSGSPSAG